MKCSKCKKGTLVAIGRNGRTRHLVCNNRKCRQEFMQDLGMEYDDKKMVIG